MKTGVRLLNLQKYKLMNKWIYLVSRKLEELQADLSTSTQKWHNLNNQLETSMREKEREIETLKTKNDETNASLTSNIEDLVSCLFC